MMSRSGDALFVAATILLTVYGQIALKWRMNQIADLPVGAGATFRRLIILLFDPIIASTFVAAFAASLAWMVALTKFELSRVYPITSLNFVLVLLISALLLAEPIDWQKGLGVALIVLGTVIASGTIR